MASLKHATAALVTLVLLTGCGGAPPAASTEMPEEADERAHGLETVDGFLDSCVRGDVPAVLGHLHPRYMAAQGVRPDLTLNELHQAMPAFDSYEVEPEGIPLELQEGICSTWVRLRPLANGHRLYLLRLEKDGGDWKVQYFDAMHWPGVSPEALGAEQALEAMLVSYVTLDGGGVFGWLSEGFKARRGITGPLPPEHLTGLGSPRFFLLPCDSVTVLDGATVAASVSIYYQSAGGKTKETRKVRLTGEAGLWRVDDLPFLQ